MKGVKGGKNEENMNDLDICLEKNEADSACLANSVLLRGLWAEVNL